MGKRGDDSYSLPPMTWPSENTEHAMSKRAVEDGLRMWAASRGFDKFLSAATYTLPARRGPFADFIETQPGPIVEGTVRGVRVVVMFLSPRYVDPEARQPYYTVVAAHVAADYPDVSVRPERGLDKLAAVAGRDVHTESDEFNKRWRVRASDPQLAHAVLSPRVIARLLQDDPAYDLPVLWDGAALYTYTEGFTAVPSELDRRVELAVSLSELTLGFHRAIDPWADADAFVMPSPPDPPPSLAAALLGCAAIASFGLFALYHDRDFVILLPFPVFFFAALAMFVHTMSARTFRRRWIDKYRRGETDE